MSGLTETGNSHGNLRFLGNTGKTVKCGRCLATTKDCICFCEECKRFLHLTCAGVKVRTVHSKRDGRIKGVVFPVAKELPLSCRDCLKNNPTRDAVTHILTDRHQRSSTIMPPPITNSITRSRIFEQIDRDAHKLVKDNENCLIHRSDQGHELKLKNYKTIYTCFWCKEKGFGPHYACKSSSCNFSLHKECKSPSTTISHPFFPGIYFFFSSSSTITYCYYCKKSHSTISCNACGMGVNGYFYHSLDNKKHLHPCCATLSSQIIYGKSETIMVLQKETTATCQHCREMKVEINHKRTNRIWSYASVSNKNVQLHVQCIGKLLSKLKEDEAGGIVVSIGGHQNLPKITKKNRPLIA
ncbi:Cysteine/histidine-rich C1 domain protein [Rhynchospora pubera]|uniref:Cysteine/histidine-rich C1 domain protein n=1 Tax=Rhynchospora pubera TaxID=906938 RepID=A0AAV8DUK9_9POAL|nr:Cysteine/histidine-rich C1 domain protein [Rhynchospora pubera]